MILKIFLQVLAFVALASADVKHLYDAPYNKPAVTNGANGAYQPVSSNLNNVVRPGHIGGPAGSGLLPTVGQVQQQPILTGTPNRFDGNSVGALPIGSGSGVVNTGINGGGLGANYGVNPFGPRGNYKATVIRQTVPLVSKASYVYAAPDDSEDIQREQTIVLPRPRQHYKVVFIKAPSTTIVNAPSTGTGGRAQEKTLIYVLSDKKRIENHIDVPDTDANKVSKPEVFFVKYNKPTEVVNSQIKYETVDAINGAENGAVNGVPNKVHGNGQLQDEPATPEQAQIADAIHRALQSGGLDGALNKVNELIKGGHSITAGNDFPSQGHFDQQPSNVLPSGVAPGSGNIGTSYPEQGYVY